MNRTYSPLVSRPLILDKNDQYESLLSIKKSFRNTMKESFYYVENSAAEKSEFNATIQRYSDKYSKLKKADLKKWQPDWSYLPRELKYFFEKDEKAKKKRKQVAPNIVKRKVKKEIDIDKLVEMIARDEEEEAEENEDETEKPKDKKSPKGSDEENENEDELENAEEDDIEEENDYIDSYFDNGENYDDDMGGGGDDDGPVY